VQLNLHFLASDYCSVIDYDDATALTTFNAADDYPNNCQSTLVNGHYRRFTPHITATFGTTASSGNLTAPWIDTGVTSIPHYGIKLAARITSASLVTINLVARLHVQFRNVR